MRSAKCPLMLRVTVASILARPSNQSVEDIGNDGQFR
jgi:hypothetical protein